MEINIYLFHRVTPNSDLLWDPMHPKLFEKCIAYIKQKYDIVQIEDYLSETNNPTDQRKKKAAIVFDDGYADNMIYAFPILERYSCPASFYIVTDCIEYGKLTWTHLFEFLFINTSKKKLDLSRYLSNSEFTLGVWRNKSQMLFFSRKLKAFLKRISHIERENILNEIEAQFDDVEIPKNLMMTWNEVKTLHNRGYKIGSHSKSHFMLGTIDDEILIFNELNESAKMIEKEIGEFPSGIAYPNGSYSEKVIEQSKKAGYKFGLAVKQLSYNSLKHSLFEIPRIELYNESWFKTKLRINGKLEKIKKFVRWQ